MHKRLINTIIVIAVGVLVVTSCNNDEHHKEFTKDWDPSYLWAVIQTTGAPQPDGHFAPSDSVITIGNIESFDPTDSTFYFRDTEYLDSVAFPTPPHEIYFFHPNQLLFKANLSAHRVYLSINCISPSTTREASRMMRTTSSSPKALPRCSTSSAEVAVSSSRINKP